MKTILTWLLGADPAELAGEGNWRLGFVAEYGNYVNLALLVVFGAMVYLVIRSYRREGDAPAGAKALLGGLRIAVCLLVLLVVFRPAVVLRFTRTLYSTVVVLLDDSRSMGFADRYSDAGLRSAMTGRFGLADDELENLPRVEIARRYLGGADGPLAGLAKDHPLVFLRFSTDRPGREAYTRPMGRLDRTAAAAPTTRPADAVATPADVMGRLTAEGYETNIPAALRDAMDSVAGRRVAGIVVVSDGQMTTADAGGRLGDAVAYARQRGMRLYPVLVGDETPPKNLAVTGLQAPREVRRGARTELTVVLAHRNLVGETVNVKLSRRPRDGEAWTDTGISKQVVLEAPAGGDAPGLVGVAGQAGRGIQAVTLNVEPGEVGQFVYRAIVPPRPDERDPNDNAAEAPLKVSDEKIKVLVVSGDAGWEFRYVRNFLLRQPELYRVSVWQQNADPEVNQAASTGMRLNRLPQELPELIGSPGGKPHPGYDVVILYDPQPTVDGFDGEFIEMLRTFVERHGGGLCFIAGNKYSSAVLRSRGPYEPLAEMLPVTLGENTSDIVERIGRRRPQAWAAELTSYGADNPVTRFAGSAEETRRLWSAMPGLYWSHPVAKVKPLARTLAVTTNPSRRTADNRPEPLLAVQPFGSGRTLYVGFDSTWRWRYIRDGYYHRLFWSNVVQYLATLQARQVVITAGGDRFSAGERVTIEVEAYDENYKPLDAETFDVQMIDRNRDTTRTLALDAVEDQPGRYKGTVRVTRTGTFTLTALADDPRAKDKVKTKTFRVELPRAEAARPEADAATMQNLAGREDRFLRIHQAERLTGLIPADSKTAVRQVPKELWSSNVTLLLIVLLLTGEWILRKKYNMA